MKRRTITAILIALSAAAFAAGVVFFRHPPTIRAEATKVLRLLTVPPENMELATPLQDYWATADLDWKVEDLPSGLKRYSWEGNLDMEREITNLRITSEGRRLPNLTGESSEQPPRQGFFCSWGESIRMELPPLRLRNSNRQSFTVVVPSKNCILEFEAQAFPDHVVNPELKIVVDREWSETVEISSPDWSTFHVNLGEIPPGTHSLTLSVDRNRSLIPEAHLRNFRFHEPMGLVVQVPNESPPPKVEYRPRNPELHYLKQENPIFGGPSEPVHRPWEVYDENRLLVCPITVRGLVRTALFMPTPSLWKVEIPYRGGGKLVFYPAVQNPLEPKRIHRARLKLSLETPEKTETLWEEEIGPTPHTEQMPPGSVFHKPLSWQYVSSLKEPPQPLWESGVQIILPEIPGNTTAELVFEALSRDATGTSRPVMLGEPLLFPPPRIDRGRPRLHEEDLLDWGLLFSRLGEASRSSRRSVARRVWLLMDWKARVQIGKILSHGGEISETTKGIVLKALNDVLERRDFYLPDRLPKNEVPGEVASVPVSEWERLPYSRILDLNRTLIDDAFPKCIRARNRRYKRLPPDRPNILLISIDTLRGDSLSCLGYDRDTTPWMRSFFGEGGVLFTKAEAPSTWTLPSHAGLFQGQYLSRHGVRNSNYSIPDRVRLLAEYFAEHGYETAAFVDRGFLHCRYGFYQGFQRYDQKGGGFHSILPRCLDWLSRRDQSVPLFLFLHTYDVHEPYNPPEPYRSAFLAEDQKPSRDDLLFTSHNVFFKANRRETTVSRQDIEYCRALYDGGILYVDQSLEKFSHLIETRKLLESPWWIVFSDHGEGFGEHGFLEHGWTVYEEMTHVPILMRFPRDEFGGTTVSERVSLIDLLPTMSEYLGWEELPPWQGRSLLPLIRKKRNGKELRIYSEVGSYAAMYHRDLKLIRHRTSIPRPDGKHLEPIEVYDLAKDPLETRNLIHHDPRDLTGEVHLMTEALKIMAQQQKAEGELKETRLDADLVQELRGLGYLQ